MKNLALTSIGTPGPAPSGRQVGPYHLIGSLGRGGMAEVFKAEHRHLGQIRAVKLLLPDIAARPEIVGRLLTEARAMARLRHPAITEVYDCDVLEGDTAFIAMEYLCGEPLRCWLERVVKLAFNPALAGAIIGSIGEGLAFAHAQGVVHRDLKPENVVLVADPAGGDAFGVKILDFGVAKLLRETPLTTTRNGCVIGTPLYMAPEQWRPNGGVDHRADIYALGCLLFELLTGGPPFDGPDDVSVMNAHQKETPPDLRALEPQLPAGFQPLLARMMAKSPDERHQSVDEVLAELETVMGVERARWGELLRTPPEFPVLTREAVSMAETQQAVVVRTPPMAAPTPDWDEVPAPPRGRRMALVASVGLVITGLVAGGVMLMTRDGAAKSVALPAPRPVVTPLPAAAPPPAPTPSVAAPLAAAPVTSPSPPPPAPQTAQLQPQQVAAPPPQPQVPASPPPVPAGMPVPVQAPAVPMVTATTPPARALPAARPVHPRRQTLPPVHTHPASSAPVSPPPPAGTNVYRPVGD